MKRLTKSLPVILRTLAILASAAGLILVMAYLAGVFQAKVDTETTQVVQAEEPTGPLGSVQLVRRPRSESAVGTIKAVHEAAVASKLLARVMEVNVTAGQAVNENDVLVRLDDADLIARLQQAEAAVLSVQAALDRALADNRRAQRLVGTNAISQAEYDRIEAAVKTGQAELERSLRAVDEAKVIWGYATIHSPLTGVVIDKRVEPGDTAMPGQVLVTLYEPDRMQILATVRESLALRLKVGDRIPARLDALDYQCLATISEIVPQAESASRSFTVKVTGACPPGVYSGMFGRIFIPIEDEEVVVVPASAVMKVGQLNLVRVVENGKVSRRSVRLGRQLEEHYEVLAGLAPGEEVVLQSSPAAETHP